MHKAKLKTIFLIAAVILFYSLILNLGVMNVDPLLKNSDQNSVTYSELTEHIYIAVMSTLCSLLFVIHFTMFLFYPRGRENLYYALALITWLLFYIDFKDIHEFPLLIYPWSFLFILRFIYCFTHSKPPGYFWIVLCYALGINLYFDVLNAPSFSPIGRNIGIYSLFIFHIFISIEILRALIFSIKKDVAGFWLIFTGGIAFSLEVLLRILHSVDIIVLPAYTREWNISIFMIMVSLFLAYRFALSHKSLEQLNADLENRVRRRTTELEKANQELRELDKLKSAFVSQASHDLRTPLTSIKSSLDNLVRGVGGGLSERQEKVASRALKSVNRLTHLINDVLDINRIESGRMVLEKSKVHLESIVKNVIQENRPYADQKKISIESSGLDRSFPLELDVGKIERVINELINNAIKYTPENGTINVSLSQMNSQVRFSVKDNGMGMSKEVCEKIFERFYRANSAKLQAKGSGLGLSIAKELVEMHDGNIHVESEIGKGTLFTLILPANFNENHTPMNIKLDSQDN